MGPVQRPGQDGRLARIVGAGQQVADDGGQVRCQFGGDRIRCRVAGVKPGAHAVPPVGWS